MTTLILDQYCDYLNYFDDRKIQIYNEQDLKLIQENFNIENILSKGKNNLTQYNKMKNDLNFKISNYSNKIKNEFKKNIDDSYSKNLSIIETSNLITLKIMPLIKKNIKINVENYFKSNQKEFENAPLLIKIILSIILTEIVIFSNITSKFIFGEKIVSCFFGPLFEEIGKQISIQLGFQYTFVSIYSINEFFEYVFKYIGLGVKIWKIALIRLSGIIFHFMTTIIQSHYFDKYPDSQKKYIGFFIGVLLHVFWNTFIGSILVNHTNYVNWLIS